MTRLFGVSTLVQSPLGAVGGCLLHTDRQGNLCVDRGPQRRKSFVQTSGAEWRPPTTGVLTVAKGKRTFQPNNRRRARVHGFRLRMRTRAGRAIVAARRRKGRTELTA